MNDIWKDPKVELPENKTNVNIFVKEINSEEWRKIVDNACFDKEVNGFYIIRGWGDYYKPDQIEKWCYESDLIKQAGGE